MLMRQERIALLLLFSVAAVVVAAHAALSMVGKEPFARPFSDHSSDGELVVIEGRVDRASITGNGGHLSLLVRNTTIFIPASAGQDVTAHTNDTIRAYGIVQTYHGKKEVVVSSAEDIRIGTDS